MTDARFWRILALIVLVAAGLRVGHLALIYDTPLYHFCEGWISSDMYANLRWADEIAAGDWLERTAFRPRFSWQDRVATPEVWSRWLGASTYYQPPLYTYLLALAIKVAGSPDFFRVLQALLGALNVGLVGLLGWKLLGSRITGLLAAAMGALYAPWILYDGELLRGTLAIFFALASLLALHQAPAMAAGDGWRRLRGWALAGAILGLAYLADSSIVTFLPLAFLWILLRGEGAGRDRSAGARLAAGAPRAAAVAAGMVAALLPLMARNLAVGAPLVAVTTRAPLAFIMGNAPDALPVGASIPESTAAILNASQYKVLPTITETLKAHHGDVGGYLWLQWRKLGGIFNSFEVPDNPSFDYAALRSPVLRYTLRFSCVAGLGLVGMLLAARRWRDAGLLYLHAASVVGLFATAQVVSRYRQPLLIALFIFGGFALAEAFRVVRSRPAVTAAILAGSVAVSLALPSHPPPGYRKHRPAEFMAASAWLESQGDPRGGGDLVKEAIEWSWAEAGPSSERVMLGMELSSLYLRNRMYPQALSALRDVLEEEPDNAAALAARGAIHQDINQPWQALQFLGRAVLADPRNPEVHARLGHLYWYVYESPGKALFHLRRALELAPNAQVAPQLRALVQQIEATAGAGAAPVPAS